MKAVNNYIVIEKIKEEAKKENLNNRHRSSVSFTIAVTVP